MGEAERGEILRVQGLLRHLDNEKCAVINPDRLDSAWADFIKVEPTAHITPGKPHGASPKHLVKPSGPLSAAVAFLLHYPSFSVDDITAGVMYDLTNSSIARLAASGFDDENTLWADTYSRRHSINVGAPKERKRFNPVKHVEGSILKLHTDLNSLVLSMMTAKVAVVFGGENATYFKKLWGKRLEEVKLWDASSLWLLFREDDRSRLERVVFFVWHPEHVNRAKNPLKGEVYDNHLARIAQMACITRTPQQETYQKDQSQRELDEYTPNKNKGKSRLDVLKKTHTGKAALGVKLEKDAEVVVQCDCCGFNRLDIEPYFATRGGYRFYAVAKGKCQVCDGDPDIDGRARTASYFVPVDRTLPWVQCVPYWLNLKTSKKTPAQIDQYWREANARMEAGEPMSVSGTEKKLRQRVEARKAAKKAATQADDDPEDEDENEDMEEDDQSD
ncbi:hypothetical protein diail_3786 [Diaporthe ilicicola]|nr:hypothetical protein diail_3786 [Diaporthe ilicicola]